ncbi:MAG: hypothetical protein IPM98_04520 [Lewinellaceae bacterium]|nr:hypothetical protein [Lewinellaceae bacterium]
MKSLLFQTRLRVLVLLGFLALGLGTTASFAQVATTPIDADLNWVAPNDAMTRIGQEIGVIEAQMQQSGGSDLLKYKLKYYNTVFFSIEEGVEVQNAVESNYGRFVTGVLDTPVVEFPNLLPPATWQQYRLEIIQLLQN